MSSRFVRARLGLVAAVAAIAGVVGSSATAGAAYVAYGTVLVQGCNWAGALCAAGDLNVYSNGTGNQDTVGTYGLQYECVELVVRYSTIRWGDRDWRINSAYQMYGAGPSLPSPMLQFPNGGAVAPQFGDILVFDKTATAPWGHVAIVSGTSPGYIDIVEQNWGNSAPTGRAQLPISGTTMPARYGVPVIGWLRDAADSGINLGTSGPGGFTADGMGGVHPYGSARPIAQQFSWPNWDIVRGMARIPNTNGGYVVDAFGGVHAFGTARPVTATAYWPGWDIVRGIAVRPDGNAGYVLDAFGGLHPFATAGTPMPTIPQTAYWPGWNIARDVALRADGVSGYTLDGFGGVHPFGGAPAMASTVYWPNWDIARSLSLRADGVSGWVLDGYNGLHPLGAAPAVHSTGYFAGQDIARGIVTLDNGGGYTVTAWGRVREFGDAPAVGVGAVFNTPVARGIG
jgi:hypothetical protein